jgi:hypothetical protein
VNSHRTAHAATIMLLIALAAGVFWKQGVFDEVVTRPRDVQPQDAIYQMLDAVRDGDLSRYIDAHTAGMEVSLRRAVREVGEVRLLESLKERKALLKGVAVLAPERSSGGSIIVRVEYVFADRSEVQLFHLQHVADRWKIARVEGAQRLDNQISFGKPVE